MHGNQIYLTTGKLNYILEINLEIFQQDYCLDQLNHDIYHAYMCRRSHVKLHVPVFFKPPQNQQTKLFYWFAVGYLEQPLCLLGREACWATFNVCSCKMSDPGVIASGEETPSPLPSGVQRDRDGDNAQKRLTPAGHKKHGQRGHTYARRGSGNDRGSRSSTKSSLYVANCRPVQLQCHERVHSKSRSKAQTDDLKELERVASCHRERLKKLEATESALAVVDRKLARSEDEHRQVIARIHSANELLRVKRREVQRVERQLAQRHLENEEVVTAMCQNKRKELDAAQRAIMEAQAEADDVRAELCSLRQSVQIAKKEKRRAEAELQKWCSHLTHMHIKWLL